MLKSEFEKLTGIFPTDELYEQIEKSYTSYSGDKGQFCKAYLLNKGGLAERIQYDANQKALRDKLEANQKAMQDRDLYTKRIDSLEQEIKQLEERLKREEEWKPYINKDNYQQDEYDHLKAASGTGFPTDDEAKDILYDWFGFAREKVTIFHEIPRYEVNRHRTLREVGTIERLPMYNSTDWNYIRFDCGCLSYELVNDQIRPFVH